MAEEATRPRLGRGLAALIGDVSDARPNASASPSAAPERTRAQRRAPIEQLKPNPRNPRRGFDGEQLGELAASIKERGVIQPIVVRPLRGATDAYEIIAGERRWRAAQMAGLHDVPIVVIDASDRESLELAVVENVQRADLNPIEEAEGYKRLIEEFAYSADEVAKIVGKSRPHIANMVRLNKLSEPVKAYVREGKLTAGHARMLLGQPNALEFAAEIVRKGLNVRQVEEWARRDGRDQLREVKRTGRLGKDADTMALENRLTLTTGMGVQIEHRADGGGVVEIRYRRLEQLDEIVRLLQSGTPTFGVVLDDQPTPNPGAAARRIRDDNPRPGDVEVVEAQRKAEEAEGAEPPGPKITQL